LDSEEGVMSLPLRLAVSMIVVSLALPLCLQSISDGGRELSRTAAMRVSEEISRAAGEVSSKPVGESRVIRTGEDIRALGQSVTIIVGRLLGEGGFDSIRCADSYGWTRLVRVDLSPEIVGFCSFDLQPVIIGAGSGDILISHGRHPCGDIVQIGFV